MVDFVGELIWRYGCIGFDAGRIEPAMELPQVTSLQAVGVALQRLRREWAGSQEQLVLDLFDRPLSGERIYQAGAFTLQRFVTELLRGTENHIGEAILRDDGTLEYLKTYRLSAGQSRRAYLLSQLAKHGWDLKSAAADLQTTVEQLIVRIDRAGFGYLIAEHVLERARKITGRRRKR